MTLHLLANEEEFLDFKSASPSTGHCSLVPQAPLLLTLPGNDQQLFLDSRRCSTTGFLSMGAGCEVTGHPPTAGAKRRRNNHRRRLTGDVRK